MTKTHLSESLAAIAEYALVWTRQNEANLDELTDWLKGYMPVPVGDSDEPYVWLLEAVRATFSADDESAFASRVAEVVDKWVTESREDELFQDTLQALLRLCAGLNCPDELAPCLDKFFRERIAPDPAVWTPSVRAALRAALIENQVDGEYESLWNDMLDSKEAVLPGNPFDGYEGILMMPGSQGRGLPDCDRIGRALSKVALYLNDDDDREIEFQARLELCEQAYPLWTTLDQELVEQAHQHRWPRWAVLALRRLSFMASRSDQWVSAYLWWELYDLCHPEEFGFRSIQYLCDGEVVKLEMPLKTYEFIRDNMAKSELIRQEYALLSVPSGIPFDDRGPLRHQMNAEFYGDFQHRLNEQSPDKWICENLRDVVDENHKRILEEAVG